MEVLISTLVILILSRCWKHYGVEGHGLSHKKKKKKKKVEGHGHVPVRLTVYAGNRQGKTTRAGEY